MGQLNVDSKTNEITVMLQLLDMLDIEGCVVTADAVGCQPQEGLQCSGNHSRLMKMGVNLLRSNKKARGTKFLARMRKQTAWNAEVLEEILFHMFNDEKNGHHRKKAANEKVRHPNAFALCSLPSNLDTNHEYATMLSMNVPTAPAPLVSVIMPVYNAEKYLRETLGYICSQTLQNIEIICVDDGSTDASRAIMQEYAAADSRLHILCQQNLYAGVARNNGMSVAKGKYLVFLDSDDIFVPDMLEKLYTRAEETAADIVCCGGSGYDEASRRVVPAKWILPGLKTEGVSSYAFYPLQETPGEIFTYSAVVPWNKLFRRAFIQENGITWFHSRSSNDLTFVCHCMAVAQKVSLINEPLMQYRLRQDSLWHSNSKPPRDAYDAHLELLKRMRNLGMPHTVIMGVYRHLLHDLNMHLAPNDTAMAAERAAILKDEYEPEFRLMETDLGDLEQTEIYTRLQAFLAPSASVIVSLTKPCRHLEKCLNAKNSCSAEIIIDITHADAEATRQATELKQRFFWIRTAAGEVHAHSSRTLHLTIDQFCANCCALKQLLEEGEGQTTGIFNKHSRKCIHNRLFYVSSPQKRSWRFFGLPLVTIKYSENCRTTKILGFIRFNRKY